MESKDGNRGETRPYHHGDLKRVILDTAQAMLAEDKGSEFTLREVARRAGVSHAAPYKHFPDKTALLAELATVGFDRLRDEIAAARHREGKPTAAEFLAASRAYIGFGTRNESLYRLMFGGEVDKAAFQRLDEAAARCFGELIAILDAGQMHGVFRSAPVREQAAAVWATLHGYTLLSMDGQFRSERVGPEPLEGVLAALLEGLVNRPG